MKTLSDQTPPPGSPGSPGSPGRAQHRPTLAMVAKAAGVAPSTVSGILNQRSDSWASAKTRRRVEQAAKRLGYRPSAVARALMGKQTATLGLVATALDPMLEDSVLRCVGFENAAREAGFITIIASSYNDPEAEDVLIKQMLDRHVDALAIYPTEHGEHQQLRLLVKQGFPLATFDAWDRLGLKIPDVSMDYRRIGELQAQYLLDAGCRRICVVNTQRSCYINDQKMAGLTATLKRAKVPEPMMANISLPIHGDRHWELDELDRIGQFFDGRWDQFDGVAALCDLYALVVMRHAQQARIRIPQDLHVVGFGHSNMVSHFAPQLATISFPAERIGQQAFELIGHQLDNNRSDRPSPSRILVEPVLMPAST